jgi:diguanylate cyclase (GGDEF)-like protein
MQAAGSMMNTLNSLGVAENAASKATSQDAEIKADDDSVLDPRSILTSLGEVVYTWDLNSDVINWGVTASDVIGPVAKRATTGRVYAGFVEPGSGRSPYDAIADSQERDSGSGVAYRTRYILKTDRDHSYMVEDSGRWFANSNGFPASAHGILRVENLNKDVHETHHEMDNSARAAFLKRLETELVSVRGSNRSVAVVVVAISDLTILNDEIGEEGGDELIDTVTRRLQSTMRRRDLLMRYAGNRHAAILVSCPVDQVKAAAERLSQAVAAAPIETSRGAAAARVTVGAAVCPTHGLDASTLLRRAEKALSQVKNDPTAFFGVYQAEADGDAARRARNAASHEVVAALNERRVILARQPVVDAITRQPAFEEGLLRLRRPDGTIAGASEIVPAVERLGLVRLVDHRVLELATTHLAANIEARLAINISPVTLADPAWLDTLSAHLGARPGVAERLIVEIVETAAIEDPAAMCARLNCMKALGVSIGIDDFGSGHTSFRHLRGFPIDLLKIDGAFVQNMSRSGDDRFFVRTLVDLAQNLGIATVAEWVENEETAAMLVEWGVDYLQGDYFGRPALPAEDDSSLAQFVAPITGASNVA